MKPNSLRVLCIPLLASGGLLALPARSPAAGYECKAAEVKVAEAEAVTKVLTDNLKDQGGKSAAFLKASPLAGIELPLNHADWHKWTILPVLTKGACKGKLGSFKTVEESKLLNEGSLGKEKKRTYQTDARWLDLEKGGDINKEWVLRPLAGDQIFMEVHNSWDESVRRRLSLSSIQKAKAEAAAALSDGLRIYRNDFGPYLKEQLSLDPWDKQSLILLDEASGSEQVIPFDKEEIISKDEKTATKAVLFKAGGKHFIAVASCEVFSGQVLGPKEISVYAAPAELWDGAMTREERLDLIKRQEEKVREVMPKKEADYEKEKKRLQKDP